MEMGKDARRITLWLSLSALAWAMAETIAVPAVAAPQPVAPPPPPRAPGANPPPPARNPPVKLSPMAALGKQMFFDTALSASGKQSCATCHSPGNAFGAPNNAPVPFGGVALTLQGLRNAPTLTYASFTQAFALNGATAVAPGQPMTTAVPTGGFMHDGRLASLAIQAQQPFVTVFEMANADSAAAEQRLAVRPYLSHFTSIFGAAALTNSDSTLADIGQAIAQWEIEDPVFHRFNSKYDAFVSGQATLTAQETAGLQAFSDPHRGNCLACHTMVSAGGVPALFTDRTFHSLGVPRNWKIVYNLDTTVLPSYVTATGLGLGAPDHQYYDMGLCGPLRTDLSGDTMLCGSFKVPTLRNVAVKHTYFHNGVFDNLNDVLSWYATRNSNPERWYTKADGSPDVLYNDLPVTYDANVEPTNAPGQPLAPNLNAVDIKNVISFLCTLTDGFDPKNPGAYKLPAQCRTAGG